MKTVRKQIFFLILVSLGFIGVRVIPMKHLIAPGGALEVLQLLHQVGVETPDEYLLQSILFVLLGLVTVMLLVRLATTLAARETPESRSVTERPLSFVGQSSRSLFERGGLLLRLLVAGACVLIVILGIRKVAPLDASALTVVLDSREHKPGNIISAYLDLQDNGYSRYLHNVVRLVKDLNKSNPSVIVLPVRWGVGEDSTGDQRYLDGVPNVLQYRVPIWQLGGAPPGGGDAVVTERRPVPSSVLIRSVSRPWPPPLLEWRPFSAMPFLIPDSSGPVMDVAVAAVLMAKHIKIVGRFQRNDHDFLIGPLTIPVDGQGRTYTAYDYSSWGGHGVFAQEDSTGVLHYVSSVGETDTILESQKQWIEGRIVFVEYHDRGFPFPISGFRTWEYAAITASILQNSMVRRVDTLEIACICVLVLIAVMLFRYVPYLAAICGTIVVGVALAGLAISLARTSGIFLQAFYFPGTALLCAIILPLVRLVYDVGKKRAARNESTF